MLQNYNDLKASYIKEIDIGEVKNLRLIDDFKYHYTLCIAFKLFIYLGSSLELSGNLYHQFKVPVGVLEQYMLF